MQVCTAHIRQGEGGTQPQRPVQGERDLFISFNAMKPLLRTCHVPSIEGGRGEGKNNKGTNGGSSHCYSAVPPSKEGERKPVPGA